MYTYPTIIFRWPCKPLILTAVSFNLTALRRDSGSIKTDGKLQRKLSQKSTVLKTRLAQIQTLYRQHFATVHDYYSQYWLELYFVEFAVCNGAVSHFEVILVLTCRGIPPLCLISDWNVPNNITAFFGIWNYERQMMSIEISDQFGDFTCGVWVKKRTVAIISDL